jgi:hypothetical protein
MSPDLLELALRKQRLQLKSAGLRERWKAHAAGFEPLFGGLDRADRGLAWLRRHPQIPVAVAVAVAVARPRAALRWVRRAFVAWQAWRKGKHWLSARLGRWPA